MANIHVRNVPEELLDALKRRAARNRRSLQGEVLRILEQAGRLAPPREPPSPLRLHQAEGPSSGAWSRAEIYGDDGR